MPNAGVAVPANSPGQIPQAGTPPSNVGAPADSAPAQIWPTAAPNVPSEAPLIRPVNPASQAIADWAANAVGSIAPTQPQMPAPNVANPQVGPAQAVGNPQGVAGPSQGPSDAGQVNFLPANLSPGANQPNQGQSGVSGALPSDTQPLNPNAPLPGSNTQGSPQFGPFGIPEPLSGPPGSNQASSSGGSSAVNFRPGSDSAAGQLGDLPLNLGDGVPHGSPQDSSRTDVGNILAGSPQPAAAGVPPNTAGQANDVDAANGPLGLSLGPLSKAPQIHQIATVGETLGLGPNNAARPSNVPNAPNVPGSLPVATIPATSGAGNAVAGEVGSEIPSLPGQTPSAILGPGTAAPGEMASQTLHAVLSDTTIEIPVPKVNSPQSSANSRAQPEPTISAGGAPFVIGTHTMSVASNGWLQLDGSSVNPTQIPATSGASNNALSSQPIFSSAIQGVSAGGSPVTTGGHTISQNPDGAFVVDATSTFARASDAATALSVQAQTSAYNSIVSTAAEGLVPGGVASIIASHTVSRNAVGSYVLDGSSSYSGPGPVATAIGGQARASAFDAGVMSAVSAVTPGAPATTFGGHVISRVADGQYVLDGTTSFNAAAAAATAMESQAKITAVSNAVATMVPGPSITTIGTHTISRATNGAYVLDSQSTYSDASAIATALGTGLDDGSFGAIIDKVNPSSIVDGSSATRSKPDAAMTPSGFKNNQAGGTGTTGINPSKTTNASTQTGIHTVVSSRGLPSIPQLHPITYYTWLLTTVMIMFI